MGRAAVDDFSMIKEHLKMAALASLAALTIAARADEPSIEGKAALLVDAQTGEVLYAKNPETQYAPASTIKLLTALIVWEHTKLQGNVQIQQSDTNVEPSHIPLRNGEIVPVDHLIHALLIGSDNDSAMALARHTAGTAGHFVTLMNQRARQLGCTDTTIKNPHGLPAKGQHTTAQDMLKIFNAVLAVPALREICATPHYRLSTGIGTQTIKNHNKLLETYTGMGPAKTGWTASSRHTYAASATRNGRELHLIILNSPNKWNDARALLDYGFKTTAPWIAPPPAPARLNIATIGPNSAKSQPANSKGLTVYKVKKGDTLSSICRRFEVNMKTVLQHNNLPNPHVINPGLILYIPLQSQ
jgi:D-alanyl-D-alanine carboxypeptidase